MPSNYLPLAFAGQVAATLWIRTRVDVAFLKVIVAMLVGLLIAVDMQTFLPFLALAAESLLKGAPSAAAMRQAIVVMPVIRFGLPALLLVSVSSFTGGRIRASARSFCSMRRSSKGCCASSPSSALASA